MNNVCDILGCDEMALRIEERLDGELDPSLAPLVELHLARCPDCASELVAARQFRDALRSLPKQRCPDRVSEMVLAKAREDHRQQRHSSVPGVIPISWYRRFRPVAAAAGLVIALLGAGWLLDRAEPQPQPHRYSASEVAKAEAEVRWALALVSDVNERAGMTIRDEGLQKGLVLPLKRTTEDVL